MRETVGYLHRLSNGLSNIVGHRQLPFSLVLCLACKSSGQPNLEST